MIRSTVDHCAKYFPLPVTLNGKAVKQQPFLHGAGHRKDWNGTRIGIYKSRQGLAESSLVNLHGQTLIFKDLPRFRTEQTGKYPGDEWYVRVEIDASPSLELILPTRAELVQNDALKALVDAAKTAIYQAMLAEGAQNIPYEIAKDARRLGIDLAAPRAKLQVWKPNPAEPCMQEHDGLLLEEPEVPIRKGPSQEPILMTADLECIDQQILHRALKLAGLESRTFHPQKKHIGYDWYDGMTRLESIAISWRRGQVVEHLDKLRVTMKSPIPGSPEQIQVLVNLARPAGRPSQQKLQVDVVCINEMVDSCDQIEVVLTENAKITTEQLADIFVDGYFVPSDDVESDSITTQRTTFERDARALATGLTRSWTEARIERLQDLAKTHLGEEVQKNETLLFAIKHNKEAVVTIVTTKAPRNPHGAAGSEMPDVLQ